MSRFNFFKQILHFHKFYNLGKNVSGVDFYKKWLFTILIKWVISLSYLSIRISFHSFHLGSFNYLADALSKWNNTRKKKKKLYFVHGCYRNDERWQRRRHYAYRDVINSYHRSGNCFMFERRSRALPCTHSQWIQINILALISVFAVEIKSKWMRQKLI